MLKFIYRKRKKRAKHDKYLKYLGYCNSGPFFKMNIEELLQILWTTNNLKLKFRIISILAAYIMSCDSNVEVIVKCKRLYDQIHVLLSEGPSLKCAIVFNFLSALLYFDADVGTRKKSLALYARNMVKASGCLAIICNYFARSMMHQETWVALCRCLAEACRGSNASQSFCSHLIPTCLKKCKQGNLEAICVLQNLLHHHKKNINLFLDCDGASLFTRDMLQYETCLQLLDVIIQDSEPTPPIEWRKKVNGYLHDILRTYGPQSTIGQWATIVIHHIDLEPKSNDTTIVALETQYADNTDSLFQNIAKEILQWNTNNKSGYVQAATVKDRTNLYRSASNNNNYPNHWNLENISDQFNEEQTQINKQNNSYAEIKMEDFQPTVASTPKNLGHKINRANRVPHKMGCTKKIRRTKKERKYLKLETKELKSQSMSARFINAINDSCTTFVKSFKNIFKKTRHSSEKTIGKDITAQATNLNSCDYSFTNYMRERDAFMAKDYTGSMKTNNYGDTNDVLEATRGSSCNTCNDTFVLKSKLTYDDHLKKTVEKLKLGINLYGCNFQKISKTMWPRETYMTPSVLYNLYKKLIVK